MPRPNRLASMPVIELVELRDQISQHLVQRRKDLERQISHLDNYAPVGRRVSGTTKRSPMLGTKVPIKYRGQRPGQTWTGRGVPPRWMEGQDPAKFLISRPAAAATARKKVARKVAKNPARSAKAAKRKG